ncbi:MAG TPA: hypothetical protein VN707_06095, partial [Casimicrobiaceae bacterium]|nr:hypothetical protein [Casimicrobiaceae bacterium]
CMVRILRLIRTSGLLLAAFLLVGHASAHPGHLAEAAPIAIGGHTGSSHGDRSNLPQLRADPSCPDDDTGSCCCTEQTAHAPSQPHALPAQQTEALTAPRSPPARVVVVRDEVRVSVPPLIGSRGSRGPPSP